MKHTFIILLSFIFATANAQSVVLDTTYITNSAGRYYKLHRVVYDNGAYSEDAQLAGDSLQLYQNGRNYIADLASQFAGTIENTWNYSRRITAMFRESDRIYVMTGRNPIDSLRAQNESNWLGTWWLRGDTSLTITISKAANGSFRWRVGTGTLRACQPIANRHIRLNNYLGTGKSIDLFSVSGDRYMRADGSLWLVRPPAAQRSVVIEAATESAMPPAAPEPVVYYSSGLIAVTTGNTTTYKRYSSAKKAWLTLTPAQAKKYM